MYKKTMISLLSIFLLATIFIALASPGSVMAAVGLTGSKGGFFEKVETRTLNDIKEGLDELAKKMNKSDKLTHTSSEGFANVIAYKGSKEISVYISIDVSKLPEATYKDFSKVNDLAIEYLKPVLNEKQTMGLCSLFFSEACDKYKKGITKIEITKKQEGIIIECLGNTDTGKLNINIKSALPVKTSILDILKNRLFSK